MVVAPFGYFLGSLAGFIFFGGKFAALFSFSLPNSVEAFQVTAQVIHSWQPTQH